MLTRFHLWLWNFLVGNNRWLQQLQTGFVSSSNSILDGLLDGDVFFRSHSWHILHPFNNFLNNVIMNVAYWIAQRVIISSNACGYPSCLLLLHIKTCHGMFVVCWHLCYKQEDQSMEWTTKGQAMALDKHSSVQRIHI